MSSTTSQAKLIKPEIILNHIAVNFDSDATYTCPMVQKHHLDSPGTRMEVKVTPIINSKKDKIENIKVTVDDPSYQELYFYPEYFDYLIWKGYIKKVIK